MAVFTIGKPIVTDTPGIAVDNKLEVGAHVFQLVVVDDDGLQSDPFRATVQVVQLTTPPIVLQPGIIAQPIDPIGPVAQPIVTQPIVTQPIVTQPIATQPILTQPILTQPIVGPIKPAITTTTIKPIIPLGGGIIK